MHPSKPPKWRKTQHCPETGKIQHRTENGAKAHALRLECGRGYDGIPVSTYRCRFCDHFHVGHPFGTYAVTFPI